MNPEGKVVSTNQVATQNASRTSRVTTRLLTMRASKFLYLPDTLPNQLLNLISKASKPFFFFVCSYGFLSMNAQSAGVSVKAITPDNTMDVDMVMENCR